MRFLKIRFLINFWLCFGVVSPVLNAQSYEAEWMMVQMLNHAGESATLSKMQKGFARYLSNGDDFLRDNNKYIAPFWSEFHWPVRRYLCSRMFANYFAYQGDGVRSGLFSVVCALICVRVHAIILCAEQDKQLSKEILKEAIRFTDFLLFHTAPRQQFMQFFNKVENLPATEMTNAIPS